MNPSNDRAVVPVDNSAQTKEHPACMMKSSCVMVQLSAGSEGSTSSQGPAHTLVAPGVVPS
jgi:hypothetical protein